jgi:hypothetical protein
MKKASPEARRRKREASHRVVLVWFGAYLGLTMVAAHMKKASPEARRRKREASHEEVWFGLALTLDSQWWRHT